MTLEDAVERIAELETLLETAIYVRPEEWRTVQDAMHVPRTQAVILVGLFKVRRALHYNELDTLIPDAWTNGSRKDSEFRTINAVRQHVHVLRRLWPSALERGNPWGGVRLTEEGRRLVGEALGA